MATEAVKTKDDYISSIEPGVLIAFQNDERMLAAKVIGVSEDQVKVKTKNGSIYPVKKADIVWVKTGSRWPAGIYHALKEGR